MPLLSLHFMSHIVALHLQDFITCFLGKSYVVSSLQAQGFHLLYIVAALTSMYRKSRKVALMAISEGSMYTNFFIALLSPLARVFLLAKSWAHLNRFLAGVQNPNPNLSYCLWNVRASMGKKLKKQSKNFIGNSKNSRVRFRIAFFHHFLTFFRNFLNFVRWRTVWFLLARSFFDFFLGSGQASVTRKTQSTPFYPSWARTKNASRYPAWDVLA